MTAAGAFRVIGVDRAAGDRADRFLDETHLVERVGMDRDLDVVIVGDAQASVDRCGRRAPILMEFEPERACGDLLDERGGSACVPFPEQADIDGQRIRRREHSSDMPRTGRAGRRVGTRRWTRPATDHRRRTAPERDVHLLRTDEMNVRVDRACRENEPFARDRFRRRADDHSGRYAIHDPWIARLPNRRDLPVTEADVGFINSARVDDRRVRNDGIEDAVGRCRERMLAHAVANDLTTAERDLVAVGRQVVFDLHDERGIGEADAVARRRSVEPRVRRAVDLHQRSSGPMTRPRSP